MLYELMNRFLVQNHLLNLGSRVVNIVNDYFVVKKLMGKVRIKAFWYTNLYYLVLSHMNLYLIAGITKK